MNILKRIRYFISIIRKKFNCDINVVVDVCDEHKENLRRKQAPQKVGKWDGDDLICPWCENRNRIGRDFVRSSIPCEKCHNVILNPRGSTPDYQDIFGPAFEQLDWNEN